MPIVPCMVKVSRHWSSPWHNYVYCTPGGRKLVAHNYCWLGKCWTLWGGREQAAMFLATESQSLREGTQRFWLCHDCANNVPREAVQSEAAEANQTPDANTDTNYVKRKQKDTQAVLWMILSSPRRPLLAWTDIDSMWWPQCSCHLNGFHELYGTAGQW